MPSQVIDHRGQLDRRTLLRVGAASAFGLSLADALARESESRRDQRPCAKSVILVWLAGGPSTIDMWDLKPDAPEEIRGEFKPIDTAVAGLTVCEHMPRLAAVINRCTLVRSLHHSIPAHDQGTRYLLTGNRPTPALDYPSLGAVVARLGAAERGVPPYVEFGEEPASNAGFLGAAYNPFRVGQPERGMSFRTPDLALREGLMVEEFDDRVALRNHLDRAFAEFDSDDLPASMSRFHQQAVDILRSDKTSSALDVTTESEAVRSRYGRHPAGDMLLASRRLIEAGVRFVTATVGGWDTHSANFRTLRDRLLPTLDQSLSALVSDLGDRGLLDETIVLCAGEFGRTPRVNNNAGRDHWARAMALLVAGGGFRQGSVHGRTTGDGAAPDADGCSPDDIAATLYHQLGFDPRQQLLTSSGRPIELAREGRIIRDLIA